VKKTERVTMNVVIFLNQACLEALAAQQNLVNYGFDKVQLRQTTWLPVRRMNTRATTK